MTRKSIPLSNPDFDGIKASLKQYLKTQDVLTGYDFESSVMSTLLDVLAYNTHFNAFYLNQVGNETFLQTAVIRDNAVKRAAEFGYVPRSARSGIALVTITLASSSVDDSIEIPSGSLFTSSAAGKSFTFSTIETTKATQVSPGVYTAHSVPIYEGKPLTHTFTTTVNSFRNGYTIPNKNVDSSTLKVEVSNNGVDFEVFKIYEDLTLVTGSDNVYFLRELEGGLVNVYFGDGVVGVKPTLGSKVRISYIISSGDVPNGVAGFTSQSFQSTVVSLTPSLGGAFGESIDSIKFNAPLFLESQNRAVTATDYEVLIRKNFPNVEDVIAWGGEENSPPQYGKVFISIKPANGLYATDTERTRIETFLKKLNVVTIKPVFVDTDYLFVNVSSVVDFQGNITSLSDAGIEEKVKLAVIAYEDTYLSQFDKSLRGSVLSRQIDSSDRSIISNRTGLTLEKRVFAKTGTKSDISVDFGNSIEPGSFSTSDFTFNGMTNCSFSDTGTGKIGISRLTSGGSVIVVLDVGTINYADGVVDINDVLITALSSNSDYTDSLTNQAYIAATATPVSTDINVSQRQLIALNRVDVTANRLVDYKA